MSYYRPKHKINTRTLNEVLAISGIIERLKSAGFKDDILEKARNLTEQIYAHEGGGNRIAIFVASVYYICFNQNIYIKKQTITQELLQSICQVSHATIRKWYYKIIAIKK